MNINDYDALIFVRELLSGAYKYDDKPHKLYSCIRAMALRFEDNATVRDEIIRLIEKGYGCDRSREN
jgi:hypothetical protein